MGAFEKSLQKATLKYLRERGFWAINIHGNEFVRGVPDILACILGRFVALELKTGEGVVSTIQTQRLRAIEKSGGVARVVRSIEDVERIITEIKQA